VRGRVAIRPASEVLQRLRRDADDHDALLIFDEVPTGFGTTGSMWAFEQLDVVPDIVAFGKKTQICGIMCTARIDEVENNVFTTSSRINSTWGGTLVDMVRCARILEIIAEDGLVENAARVGEQFLAGLRALAERLPEVTNPRGRGLILAFDLPDTETRDGLRTELWSAGLASLSCGPRSLRFRPSLTFGEAEVARALDTLDRVLSARFAAV
jgi:L-lysine 6-transaminase